jgi:endonuclease YncB( thermonuclease family)
MRTRGNTEANVKSTALKMCEHDRMFTARTMIHRRALGALSAMLFAVMSQPAFAAACSFESQGEGHVSEIIDGRSFRLDDGREIVLAAIEQAVAGTAKADRTAALSALVRDHDVTLRGQNDTPDRYGRQSAFVFLDGSDTPIQRELLAQGAALVSAAVTDRECASLLAAAESEARQAKKGTWSDPAAIKNAESPDDILTGIGRFTLVEGRVFSVRQAGTTTYLNFGRSWTRDFAVTVSRRMMPAFESAGIVLKSLENRRIRVRGWVEARPGPRIDVVGVGQIEMLGAN